MERFGFEDDLFAEEPEHESKEVEEEEVPEVDEESEPIVKRGEIWKLGDHYLMCGDSTSKEDVERLMNAGDEP